ncbi:golgin family A protein [Fagus crenata]
MPRQNRGVDLIPGKIRKRGCTSSASSSSSILQNYRFKRAILVGKRGGSTTPVPTWRLMSSSQRGSPAASVLRAVDSPKPNGGLRTKQHQQTQPPPPPVSARKLAATLWEMNEIPSPSPSAREVSDERRLRKKEAIRGRERMARSVHSGSLPPHLSDPSHSPVSERMDRSGTGSRRRGTPSISQRLRLTDHHHVGAVDALSNASLMEIETRSRAQTPSACTSTVGSKTRLKDVSNALTTSKELLKIINRVWGHEDRPSTSMSLISALHAELERARLQVNQLIQEQRSDQSEINYLIKCFTEEKASWESKEQEIVEAAIESVAGELEVERKLRRRLESLNKKLGRELAETKASLVKVVKELESEKRAREIVEQVCDELARDVGEDKAQVEEEVKKIRKEVEEEREMMHLADVLREGKVQMKLSEAKHQIEEKNSAVDKLRNQLEAFLGTKRVKERGGRNSVSHHHRNDDDIAALLSRARFSSNNLSDEKEEDGGVVEDGEECEQVSAESDLHSIELNMDNYNKSYKWNHALGFGHDPRLVQIEEEETKGRKSTSGRAPRRSTSLQRSISDGVELHNSDRLDWGRLLELEKQAQGKGYGDELQGYKSVKGLRDQMLSSSLMGSPRVSASPTRQMGQPWSPRDLVNAAQERTAMIQGNGLKSRLGETGGIGHNARKSRR